MRASTVTSQGSTPAEAARVAGASPGVASTVAPSLETRARRRLRRAWLLAPGGLLGLLVARLCGAPIRGRPVPVEGVGVAVVLEDPRLARYLDAVPLRPVAQTLGPFVLARGPLPDALVRHELVHVRQWARFGPFFLVLYGAASLRALLAGGDPYRDNAFERAARAAE